MLARTDVVFDYATLPAEKAASARAAAEQVRTLVSLAVANIIEAGKVCSHQKEALGHGHFKAWVASELDVSYETVVNWMRVAKEFGDKNVNLTFLKPSTLYALAAPSTPEPVRTEILERAASGERVTAKEIETLKKEHERTKKALADAKGRLSVVEGHAESVKRQRDELDTKYRFASADKDRLELQLEELQDEIERLKDSDTIHVIREPVLEVMGQMTADPSVVLQVEKEAIADWIGVAEFLVRNTRQLPAEAQVWYFKRFGFDYSPS